MSTTYVATSGDRPTTAGTNLPTVQASVMATETRYTHPDRELRWDEVSEGEWRLMSRTGGRGRWAWTQRAVHAVPTAEGDAR